MKPVILSVDDDPSVRRAISRDLRQRYGNNYRVMQADSGHSALATLDQLKKRNTAVALFLVDQRMPQMGGVEFLAQARRIYPDTKRTLLTAYADTEAAIHAINSASVHYYLLKPWDPPEEALYPVLDDLLEEWQASYHPPFTGIRLIGHRWSPETHELKYFLARNQIPYQYLDIELEVQASEVLAQSAAEDAPLPVVVLPDGVVLQSPTTLDVAKEIGLEMNARQTFYDLVIIGGGPAGLAAAVYGASEGLRTVMIEREAPGGQAGTSSRIENYLGFPSGLSGADLSRRAVTQAKRFGVEILAPQEATSIRQQGPYRIITLADGSEVSCHAVIVAVGLAYRQLNLSRMNSLRGAGVYYGASLTEVISCQDKTAVVVGAGNSAGQAAIYLSQYAAQVIIVVRGDSLETKMSQYLVERIEAHPRIDVRLQTEIASINGNGHLEKVIVENKKSNQREELSATALFIFIGAVPCTEWLRDVLDCDERGFIRTGPQLMVNGKRPASWPLDRDPFLLESSVPGIFAVGDVRNHSVKRVASAVGEGSVAIQFVHQYLNKVR